MSLSSEKLSPQSIWTHFKNLNAVPRASKKEEKVIAFIQNFGAQLNLDTTTDAVGNVIIKKPGSANKKNHKTVVLQSHLDMVHQKNNDTVFDFDTQGIEMYIEEDWVKAKGTTLGADNGMGVAAIMAILEDNTLEHPPLEALFTIDEETGMTGALGLQPGVLKGSYLLNLDTEDDDEIDIGCAGGVDISATAAYFPVAVPTDTKAFVLEIKNLLGGHSGMDIDKERGNANKIMNRLLLEAHNQNMIMVSSIHGGGLRNAIPRESKAVVVVPIDKTGAFQTGFTRFAETIKKELADVEPDLFIGLSEIELPAACLPPEFQKRVLNALAAAHNGVFRKSTSMDNLVETSNNIAKVSLDKGQLRIDCLTRSAIASGKEEMKRALTAVFDLAGFETSYGGAYPGWAPNMNSDLLKLLTVQYRQLFKEEPRVVACHAGLECGILGRHYPDMDMISFGPTIKGAHSPDERVSITSVRKFWKFLLAVLQNMPK